MTLLSSPEKEAARRNRAWLLLLGGLVILIVVTAVMLALQAVEKESSGLVGRVDGSGSNQVAKEAGDEPTFGTTEGVEQTGESGDPVAVVSPGEVDATVACQHFRNGETVAQFAAWYGTVAGSGHEEQFQQLLLDALTQVCPEVIPGT
jgi:hypothetical protein